MKERASEAQNILCKKSQIEEHRIHPLGLKPIRSNQAAGGFYSALQYGTICKICFEPLMHAFSYCVGFVDVGILKFYLKYSQRVMVGKGHRGGVRMKKKIKTSQMDALERNLRKKIGKSKKIQMPHSFIASKHAF